MGERDELDVSDRLFIEQIMTTVRQLGSRFGPQDKNDASFQRAYALVLMREALGALDAIGDAGSTPHLQMAIDRLLGVPNSDGGGGIH